MKSTQEITREVQELGRWIPALREQVSHVVVGQKYLVDRLLLGLLANGHHVCARGARQSDRAALGGQAEERGQLPDIAEAHRADAGGELQVEGAVDRAPLSVDEHAAEAL